MCAAPAGGPDARARLLSVLGLLTGPRGRADFGMRPAAVGYFTTLSLSPSAASLRLAPCVVLFSSMTTPF